MGKQSDIKNKFKNRNARQQLMGGANTNTDTEINNEINANSNNETSVIPSARFEEGSSDPLTRLQQEIPRKELTQVMKGIYFDGDVAAVIDSESKKLGRGGKSRLVNEIVKKYFKDQELL